MPGTHVIAAAALSLAAVTTATTVTALPAAATDGSGSRETRSSQAVADARAAAPKGTSGTGTGALTFSASGMDAAGFQNVVAVDPRHNGVMISAADVAGFHRSADWGRTWQTSNLGLSNLTQLHVASVVFDPTVPGKVWAATGHRGGGGGVMVSTDEGRSWALRSTTPKFSGSNNAAPLPTRHPRSTGDLVAVDPRGHVYVATFKDGVMRSSDDGRTWKSLGLAGHYLRSLAIDPARPDVVYAAAYNGGVFRTGNASGAGTFAKLTGTPAVAEEIRVIGDDLYVAAGSQGVLKARVSTTGAATWTNLRVPTGPTWISVDGHSDAAGRHTVFVGNDRPRKSAVRGHGHESLLRSLDGGTTWASVTSNPALVRNEVGGPGGPSWWLLDRQSSMAIGRGSYTAAHIEVTGGRVFVAGRSGVWGSDDNGTTWYPRVKGMGVTISKQVIADPTTPGRVYVANTDWVTLYSTDGGRTVTQNRPPAGVKGTALALDTATRPATVYSAVGERDHNTHGEIYTNPDPATSRTWTSEGIGKATGGKRVVAMAVQRVGGKPVILAAVQASGVWRKQNGTWTRVSSAAMVGGHDFASLVWATPTTAYLHDPKTGVWRSKDQGKSWTRIWQVTSFVKYNDSLAVDPKNPARLYVAVPGKGVHRIDDATGATVKPVKLDGVVPGPLATTADGSLYVAAHSSGSSGRLQVVGAPGARTTALTDPVYAAAAHFPFSLSIGPEGNAYVTLNGNGFIRGSRG